MQLLRSGVLMGGDGVTEHAVMSFMLLTIGWISKTSGIPVVSSPSKTDENKEPQQQPINNLDLRILDYHLDGDKPLLGDELLLEFKSDNLTGIVRLNRVDDNSALSLKGNKNKKTKGGKGKNEEEEEYDQKGAMYFAVTVVTMYGLSIGVLVAFSLRRDWDEDEVKHFQRRWVKMDHLMEKQEKQRAKKLMTEAIIDFHQPKSSLATVTSQAVYMALAPAVPFAAPSTAIGVDQRGNSLWNILPPQMGTIEEGIANSSEPTSSSSPAVSAITIDDGPIRTPPLSLPDTPEPSNSTSSSSSANSFKQMSDEDDIDDIEKILEEGQLEAQLSVDLPDTDQNISNCPSPSGRRSSSVSRMPSRKRTIDVPDEFSPDGSDEVFLKPQSEGPALHSDNLGETTPLRTLMGIISPSLPYMDDEAGHAKINEQDVWVPQSKQTTSRV